MIVELSIFPIGTGVSLSSEVARIVKIIDAGGLPYQLTAMSTIIEGDWDRVMAVIKECHEALLEKSERVYTRIVIDDHKGKTGRLRGKVESIEKRLGKKPA